MLGTAPLPAPTCDQNTPENAENTGESLLENNPTRARNLYGKHWRNGTFRNWWPSRWPFFTHNRSGGQFAAASRGRSQARTGERSEVGKRGA